eukprot:6144410-Prymnesium_polylepis.2
MTRRVEKPNTGFTFKRLPVITTSSHHDMHQDNLNSTLSNAPVNTPANTKVNSSIRMATVYLWGCFFYNCCCCCFPKRCVGEWCGEQFMCGRACICLEIKLRCGRLLWLAHFVCFCIHLSFAITTVIVAGDNDMTVKIFRVKPSWESIGPDGYVYEVAPAN